MNKMIKLNSKTLEKLRCLINEDIGYRTGPKLVEFFNELGFNEVYDNNFPSRWKFTDDCLNKINNTENLIKCIEKVFNPINFIERDELLLKSVENFNKYLLFDNYKIVLDNTRKTILIEETNENNNINSLSEQKNLFQISIRSEIYNHIKRYLDTEDYFHAVDESYKVVREKLKSITGEEKATNSFKEEDQEKILGYKPQSKIEKDFFDGIKFLHMSIQMFRNEKAHSIANDLDKTRACHYIVLASLAYDLISQNKNIVDTVME